MAIVGSPGEVGLTLPATYSLRGAGDIFLLVETTRGGQVKGESSDPDHKDEIELIGWSWAMRVPVLRAGSGGGEVSGRAAVEGLRVIKRLDRASPVGMRPPHAPRCLRFLLEEDNDVAYHFSYIGTGSGKNYRLYSLDYAVGQGAINNKDDVMLVQIYLHIVYYENQNPEHAAKFPPPAGYGGIEVDGQCGPITQRHIMHYKNQLRAEGAKLYPDMVMDPFRDNDPMTVGTRSGTRYAFGVLSRSAVFADENRVQGLIEDPRTPPALALALTQVRDQPLQYGGGKRLRIVGTITRIPASAVGR